MGKFTGVLIASDFDNTLVYTEEALQKCVDMPPVSDENRAAIEYFMANGGIFSVATGRAKPAFETVLLYHFLHNFVIGKITEFDNFFTVGN